MHFRPRRSCLAVPGSNPKMLRKAMTLPADQTFLDLEDAVAPAMKEPALDNVIEALNSDGWDTKLRVVRVNDVDSPTILTEVLQLVRCAGDRLDAIMMPKVRHPRALWWLDTTLGQLERQVGLAEGGIAIEAQIEDPAGLVAVEQIASASERLATLIFGPADFMAATRMRSLVVGEQPEDYETGDAYHYPLMRILVAARANGLQAIDGPYGRVGDVKRFEAMARSAAALGFDGKWALHPDQIAVANEAFTPTPAELARAELILDRYERSISPEGGEQGATMLDGAMIDEASRKMAAAVVAIGSAAGIQRDG